MKDKPTVICVVNQKGGTAKTTTAENLGNGLDMVNHPNWFDASFISWLFYDSLHLELPDGNLCFAPIINW